MTTTSSPSELDVLRAYIGAVLLVEPLQLSLWNSAHITLTQRRILRLLRDGQQCASDLARAAGMSAPSLTRLLDRLEDEGYVERNGSDTDRRRVEIQLSEAGRRLMEGQGLFKATAFEAAARAMSPDERSRFAAAFAEFTARVLEVHAQLNLNGGSAPDA